MVHTLPGTFLVPKRHVPAAGATSGEFRPRGRMPFAVRLAGLALLAGIAGVMGAHDGGTREGPPPSGAHECPCLNGTESQYASARAALVTLTFPAGYGMEGCKAYDKGLAFTGCSTASPPGHCDKPWCYVDVDKCPMNVNKCIASGGQINGEGSPYCRGRDHEMTVVLKDSIAAAAKPFYSYQTCGAVDVYGPAHMAKILGAHHLRISVSEDPYAPWVVKGALDKAKPHWNGNEGATS
jgi:hypothetical protein